MEDIKSINYSMLIPILTKAIQEQEQKINAQQQQIEALTQLVKQLVASKKSAPAQDDVNPVSNTTYLEQNIPNPFSKNTTIKYSLPIDFTNALIVITDKNGKIYKRINISGNYKGSVNIDLGTLPTGTYHYTLYTDGKMITSKQMILAR